MPQHIWQLLGVGRICAVCWDVQTKRGDGWHPPVSPICAGDDDDPPTRQRRGRPKPLAPSGAPRELVEA